MISNIAEVVTDKVIGWIEDKAIWVTVGHHEDNLSHPKYSSGEVTILFAYTNISSNTMDEYTHTHIHTHTHTYIHTHIHTHIYIYTHTHTHTHIYIHTHIHTHIHTYTHT